MRKARVWLLGTFLAALAGAAVLSGASSGRAEPERERAAEAKSRWENHDGRWSYWDEGDRRWYYTDGTHWYSNDGGADTAWNLYRFDKDHKFGADFERGEYKVPEEGARIEVPHHHVNGREWSRCRILQSMSKDTPRAATAGACPRFCRQAGGRDAIHP